MNWRIPLLLVLALGQWALQAHPHLSGGARSVRIAGKGIASSALFNENDSLRYSLDFYSYVGTIIDPGSWHTGEPLGAGGKLPLFHNRLLYTEAPWDRPYLYKSDLRTQYSDFSYIPLWQPNQLGTRLRYRLLPRLWGAISFDYNGEPSQINATDAMRTLEFTELNFKWAPEAGRGFVLRGGLLQETNAYSSLFDQMPLRNLRYNGLSAGWNTVASGASPLGLGMEVSAGREFLGRTQVVSPSVWSEDAPVGFVNRVRERNILSAQLQADWRQRYVFKLIGGYQVIPSDTTHVSARSETPKYLPRASGWHAGAELSHMHPRMDNHLVAAHGEGDVLMGWGAPDYVFHRINQNLPDYGTFSRRGSALTYAVYWSEVRHRNFSMESGLWAMWRTPASQPTEFVIWDFVNGDTAFTLDTERFRAVKWAFQPSYKAFRALRMGLRYDGILYLDPGAHGNTLEPAVDEMQQPLSFADPASGGALYDRPSLWEREAVDTHILSPFAALEVGNVLFLRIAHSTAFYSRPLRRQGVTADSHSNLSLAAWLTYRFAALE